MYSDNRGPFSFLRRRPVQILSLVLLLQCVTYYVASRSERIPLASPLAQFPAELDGWSRVQEGVIEEEIQRVLQADDLITRVYATPQSPAAISLFIAYFQSQRTGKAPHSPKNCLPGSGWVPTESGTLPVPIPGQANEIEVNRYVVAKGDHKSLVMYWYQSNNRVIASEYKAKLYLVADSIRYNRSDTAMVRVVVPVVGNELEVAERTGVQFIQKFYPAIRKHLST